MTDEAICPGEGHAMGTKADCQYCQKYNELLGERTEETPHKNGCTCILCKATEREEHEDVAADL